MANIIETTPQVSDFTGTAVPAGDVNNIQEAMTTRTSSAPSEADVQAFLQKKQAEEFNTLMGITTLAVDKLDEAEKAALTVINQAFVALKKAEAAKEYAKGKDENEAADATIAKCKAELQTLRLINASGSIARQIINDVASTGCWRNGRNIHFIMETKPSGLKVQATGKVAVDAVVAWVSKQQRVPITTQEVQSLGRTYRNHLAYFLANPAFEPQPTEKTPFPYKAWLDGVREAAKADPVNVQRALDAKTKREEADAKAKREIVEKAIHEGISDTSTIRIALERVKTLASDACDPANAVFTSEQLVDLAKTLMTLASIVQGTAQVVAAREGMQAARDGIAAPVIPETPIAAPVIPETPVVTITFPAPTCTLAPVDVAAANAPKCKAEPLPASALAATPVAPVSAEGQAKAEAARLRPIETEAAKAARLQGKRK